MEACTSFGTGVVTLGTSLGANPIISDSFVQPQIFSHAYPLDKERNFNGNPQLPCPAAFLHTSAPILNYFVFYCVLDMI